jgi:hypothetical protein
MTDRCRECGRPLGYLMQAHHDQPGLIGSLKGERGEVWRVFVTVAVCLLVVLAITGLSQLVTGSGL